MSDQGVPAWRSGAAARIAELEAELDAALTVERAGWDQAERMARKVLPPWHLRDDDGKVWRVEPRSVDGGMWPRLVPVEADLNE